MEAIERINPFIHSKDLMYPEHLARYMFAAQLAVGKNVLDCSCGNGYGAYYLAKHGAKTVLGIDIDPEAVAFSRAHFSHPSLRFELGDAQTLRPIDTASIDLYVSFETIEHVDDIESFLLEARRVLKPNGIFIVSCPNDGIFNPENPFHRRAFRLDEFVDAIASVFAVTTLFVQNNTTGTSIFIPDKIATATDDAEGVMSVAYPIQSKAPERADTWIAICGDLNIDFRVQSTTTFFTDYSDYIKEIQVTLRNLYLENQRLAHGWEEYAKMIKENEAAIEGLYGEVRSLQDENQKLAGAWKLHVEQIAYLESVVESQQKENERLARSWDEHVAQITNLDSVVKSQQIENEKLSRAWDEHDLYIRELERTISDLRRGDTR